MIEQHWLKAEFSHLNSVFGETRTGVLVQQCLEEFGSVVHTEIKGSLSWFLVEGELLAQILAVRKASLT